MGQTGGLCRGEKKFLLSLVGKRAEERLFGRPMCRREDITKMCVKEWDGRAWTGLMWLTD